MSKYEVMNFECSSYSGFASIEFTEFFYDHNRTKKYQKRTKSVRKRTLS